MTPWLCEDYEESGSGGSGSSPIAVRVSPLPDAISCTVREERNGAYTLEMTYAINGYSWSLLAPDKLIEVRINDEGQTDYFRIFSVEKDSAGLITVRANHISYDLSYMYFDHPAAAIAPPAGGELPAAAVWIAITQVCPEARAYTFTSDVTRASGFVFANGVLGVRQTITGTGKEEDTSILGGFGGELKWYRNEIQLLQARGQRKNIRLSYGGNVTRVVSEVNSESHYGGIVGFITYYYSGDEDEHYASSTVYFTNRTTDRLLLVDLTEYLGDTEVSSTSQAQTLVDQYAQKYANKVKKKYNKNYTVRTVEAAPTWYSPDTNGTPLALCDTVRLNYAPFGVDEDMMVVETEYDPLEERYTKLTLGSLKANFIESYVANTSGMETAKVTYDMYPQIWKRDIRNATEAYENLGERIHDGTSTSLSSGTTMQNLASFTLTKGTWMVSASVRFASNSTGRRAINLANSSGGSALNLRWGDSSEATNGAYTYLHLASSIVVAGVRGTYYINGYQNSGSALTTEVAWDCIRIL